MIIDGHTHIGFKASLPEEIKHGEAVECVDLCIVLAGPDGVSEDVNSHLADYVYKNSSKMIGFGVVDPVKDKIKSGKIEPMQEKFGLKGIVLHCSESGFHPAHSKAMQLYGIAEEKKLPIFFHNGGRLSREAVLDYAQPYLLDEVAREFRELKMVIGTMGFPFVDQTLQMLAKHENVYADLSINPESVWQVYNTVASAKEYGVMDKLLFGSGYPANNSKSCVETLFGFNRLFVNTDMPAVPRSEIQAIIERNTLEVLGISI